MLTRILLSLPLWLAYTLATTVLDLIGLVILLPLSLAGAWDWRYSNVYPRGWRKDMPIAKWRGGWLTWLWGNEEDGVTGSWAWQEKAYVNDNPASVAWRAKWLAYRWSALRNPSNNVRFIPWINPVIDPLRVRSLQRLLDNGTRVTLTWQGAFHGLLVVFPFRNQLHRFWWGWKLKPEDVFGVSDDDMRKPRCGFTLQFKRL